MMAVFVNWYEILNVAPDANPEEIIRAYRRAMQKHHPDKNIEDPSSAEQRFLLCKSAFKILSNPQNRSLFDQELALNNKVEDVFDPVFESIMVEEKYEVLHLDLFVAFKQLCKPTSFKIGYFVQSDCDCKEGCELCQGQLRRTLKKEGSICIPQNYNLAEPIVLLNRGHEGEGVESGDVWIHVRVIPQYGWAWNAKTRQFELNRKVRMINGKVCSKINIKDPLGNVREISLSEIENEVALFEMKLPSFLKEWGVLYDFQINIDVNPQLRFPIDLFHTP